jgi:alpha-1,6-mannosyltransferase
VIVADVSSFFASSSGGIRTYYEAKARWLPQLGYDCHFIVPGRRREVIRLGGGWLHRIAGPPIGGGYRAFGDVGALRATLRELKPNVVEIASHYVLPQLIAPALRGAAIVGFYHADIPQTYVAPAVAMLPRRVRDAAVGLAWRFVRAQHGRYAATLTGSHGVARRLAERGVPRVRVLGLGVDADHFRPRSGTHGRRVGYVGRLADDKEVGVLLAAAAAIARSTGARVSIAGDGPQRPSVDEAAARGDIEALGQLSRDEVATFLASLDVLVVPGRYETFGLAALEALACGTPVIAAVGSGAAELAERSGAGATFAAGSSHELAAAIAELYSLPACERAALRGRARSYAVTQRWERVFARASALYEEVASC